MKKQKKVINDDPIHLGSFSVDSGQIFIGDPCYLDKFESNEYSENPKHKKKFSYAGACQASLSKKRSGTLGNGLGVALGTLWGDGYYDVLGIPNEDGEVEAVVIPLDIFPDELGQLIKNRS